MSVAMDLDPEEFYRTNDMAAATYLQMKEHPVQRLVWEHSRTCYWVFRITDVLLDDIEEFSAGTASVEPRAYNRVFAQTKQQFYDSKSQLHK